MSRKDLEALSQQHAADESSTTTDTPSMDELADELDAIRRERAAEVAHLYA